MALRVFLGLVVAATLLRFAPILILRLLLLLPEAQVGRAIRLVRAAFSGTKAFFGGFDHARTPRRPGIRPIKLLLVSSSLLALMALIATALLKWHPASLMLLLR